METWKQIADYLDEKGISQKFISDKTGISAPILNMSLHGKRKLTLGEYAAICYVLGVDTNYFLKPRVPEEIK